MKILCEFTQDAGMTWTPTGSVGPDDMMGSFSDLFSGRDVYLFGWRDGAPGLWRAMGGMDTEVGELRKVETTGLELISHLDEPHEMSIVHPTQGAIRLRLSLVND